MKSGGHFFKSGRHSIKSGRHFIKSGRHSGKSGRSWVLEFACLFADLMVTFEQNHFHH